MTARKSIAAILATAILTLALASAASAAPITIGSPLKGEFTFTYAAPELGTFMNYQVNDPSAKLVSPVDGAVIRWRLSEGFLGGDFRVQILRKDKKEGEFSYNGGQMSAPEKPNFAPATYSTVLPIKKGDTVGLVGGGNLVELGVSLEPRSGAEFLSFTPPPNPLEGTGTGILQPEGEELGFNAEILPAPTVGAISPANGPMAGGTKVTIPGTDFQKVTKVLFGTTPAASYKVESEGKIVATAPAGTAGASVPVSVTTVAGTATAGGKFTYAKPKAGAAKPGKGKKQAKPKAS